LFRKNVLNFITKDNFCVDKNSSLIMQVRDLLSRDREVQVLHVYKEANSVTNWLANHDLSRNLFDFDRLSSIFNDLHLNLANQKFLLRCCPHKDGRNSEESSDWQSWKCSCPASQMKRIKIRFRDKKSWKVGAQQCNYPVRSLLLRRAKRQNMDKVKLEISWQEVLSNILIVIF
jgi:hypothetical protein